MPSPLNELNFVLNRFEEAFEIFMHGPGLDLLRLKKDGGGTEQQISGEFAENLKEVLQRDGVLGEAEVDAEYYYDGDNAKMMVAMKQYADVIERARRRLGYDDNVGIRPDIIVHCRGPKGPNYLVVEVKKWSNPSKAQEQFDLLKLEMLTSPAQKYHYGFGLQVRACDSRNVAQRQLKLLSVWRNGKRVPLDLNP